MDVLRELLKVTAARYNKSLPHHDNCKELIFHAHKKLSAEAKYKAYGQFKGKPAVPYNVFAVKGVVSRPVRPDIFISDADTFAATHAALIKALPSISQKWTDLDITRANQFVYTAVMSVACCYDLWLRKSRKTPGTFFEIVMASLLQQMLPKGVFTKHIPLAALLSEDQPDTGGDNDTEEPSDDEGGEASVSTDLVIARHGVEGGIVVPLKITTRERIVQPFAHQRILDAAFGEGRYHSLLVCISETQLDDKTQSVKQVCVPGTVKLFQKYLAPIRGLYYCDLPQRYVAPDMQKLVPVRSVGHFFKDIDQIFNAQSAKRN